MAGFILNIKSALIIKAKYKKAHLSELVLEYVLLFMQIYTTYKDYS